jgi:hypothetical protein
MSYLTQKLCSIIFNWSLLSEQFSEAFKSKVLRVWKSGKHQLQFSLKFFEAKPLHHMLSSKSYINLLWKEWNLGRL